MAERQHIEDGTAEDELGYREEQMLVVAAAGPAKFVGVTSPPPRKAPPPPTAYVTPAWLSPPSVDPPFEAPVAPATPSTPRSRNSLREGREPLTLSKLQEFLALEQGLTRSCRTLPLTIALWISFMCLVFNHGQAEKSFECARLVREVVEDARVSGSPDGSNEAMRLNSVKRIDQVLQWVDGAFVPALYTDALRPGRVQQTQQLLGFVRMTQTRGENTTVCEHLSSDLMQFYRGGCHPPGGTVAAYGPHATDYAFRPTSERGSSFEAWLEIGRSAETVRDRVRFLQANNWIDLSTQEIVIEAVFLNAEAYLFSHLILTFTLHREGWLQVVLKVRPMQGEMYPHWTYAFLDAVWILIMILLLTHALIQLQSARKRRVAWLHMTNPFALLDWLSVIIGLCIGTFFWFLVSQLASFEDYFLALGDMPQWAVGEAPDNRKVQTILENVQYQNQLSRIFDYFSTLSMMTEYHRLCSFWYSLLIMARFFRGFMGQPRIAVLMQTVMAAADFFLHYCVIFCVVFGNFGLGGYILFGEQLEKWSTLGRSTSHLFSVLFGEFDYNEFHGVAPVTAACWFWFFYVLVVLVLAGLLTAAFLDAYLSVRERLGEPGASLPQQVVETLSELSWFRSYEGSQKSVPDAVLLQMISKGSDPARLERLGRLQVDRRLRTRADLQKAEDDPVVDAAYLVGCGCDQQTAERLLERCSTWKYQMATTSNPAHRLTLVVARQMSYIRAEASRMKLKTRTRNEKAARAMDRLDLKHAKCVALARRIRKAQELPREWSQLQDEHGRRYLRNDATGLTSWTLPRNLF